MNPTHPLAADRPLSQDEIEERAIDEYARENSVDYAAAAWHLRQTKGFENAEEEREFAAWLSADPAHEAAFRLTERAFDELRGFSPRERARLMAGIGALADAPPDAFRRPPAIGAFFGRPLFPRLAAAACAAFPLLAAGWLVLENRTRPVFEQRHASARGQQSSLSLPDGSVLFFDTLTQAEIIFYRDRREVRLPHGQILFTVAAGAAKPFEVFAGSARVRVTGTRFSVRHIPGGAVAENVEVRVAEGRVEVSGRTADGQRTSAVELAAGQGLSVSGEGTPGGIASLAPDEIAPWRAGRVTFNGVPLAEVLAEFERYGPTGLVVRDPEVARLRVGGNFQLRRLDLFIHTLPRFLPVRLEKKNGVTEIVWAGAWIRNQGSEFALIQWRLGTE